MTIDHGIDLTADDGGIDDYLAGQLRDAEALERIAWEHLDRASKIRDAVALAVANTVTDL